MFNISPELGAVVDPAASQLKPMAPILLVASGAGTIGDFSPTFSYHFALRLKSDAFLPLIVIFKFAAATSPLVSTSYLFPYWSYACTGI